MFGKQSLSTVDGFSSTHQKIVFPRILLDILSLNRVDPRADQQVGTSLRQLFPEVDRVAITGNSPLTIMRDLFYRRFVEPAPIREFASVDAALGWLLE